MSKLHEVLAVESDLVNVYKKILEEASSTFGKAEHFTETTKSKRHFNEEDQKLDTDEVKVMTTTVVDKLLYCATAIANRYDVLLRKEATNQVAKSDLVVEGTVIAKDVPVVVLLNLESMFKELRDTLEKIPTLRPGVNWDKDDNRKYVYKTREPETSFSTRKTTKAVVLYPHTDKHAAQVKEVVEDQPCARLTTFTYSGMIRPVDKSNLLVRLDKLLIATKQARQRANNVDVIENRIGKSLMDYLYQDII